MSFLSDHHCDCLSCSRVCDIFQYPPDVRRWEYLGWEYSSCNTSLLSRYENYCIIMHKHEYSWVVKIRNTSEAGLVTLLGHHTDRGPMGLGQYDGLGEYCDHHTASSVFLLLIGCGFPEDSFKFNTLYRDPWW